MALKEYPPNLCWVAAVSPSAEMTPHPQLHQPVHRPSESCCKMWFWTKPCALVRGWLGQARRGLGLTMCFDLDLLERGKQKSRERCQGRSEVDVR
jgi:hypothetical protein